MLCYADGSFVVSMAVRDANTDIVRDTYKRLEQPILAFSQLHDMEVRNALRLYRFLLEQSGTKKGKEEGAGRLKRAEARLEGLLERGILVRRTLDWLALTTRFEILSSQFSVKFGTRTLDILHVAAAMELGIKNFITCDHRQAGLAKAAGLKVTLVRNPAKRS